MLVFDYQKTMAQVRQLRQIADDLRKMHSQAMAEVISGVESAWKGETGRAYLAKCVDLSAQIEKEAANISKLADTLESTATAISQEEKAAAETIKKS